MIGGLQRVGLDSMAVLANKVAVVTGGSGTVGSGIIYQLLSAGAKVVAPIR